LVPTERLARVLGTGPREVHEVAARTALRADLRTLLGEE
jgi:hypothetical protein